MNPELTFLWVKGEEIGYARTGSFIAAELAQRGVRIWDDDNRPPTTDAQRKSAMKKVNEGREGSPEPTNAICWVSVPTHASGAFQGQYKAILTMWEAMTLPESFRDTIHEFDLLMVPSWQNLELFSKYHDNVKLVTLGVDPSTWYYSPPPKVHTTFDFLISGRGTRKGCDVAYEAFQTVFGKWWEFDDDLRPRFKGPLDKPAPQLIMKSLKGHGEYYAPGIKHVTGKLEAGDENELYRRAHCYLQPSRGEGFGLQPLQALAVGRPTILTAAHGHESYAHLGIGISSEPTKADYFIYGDAGEWWEPNFEEVCEAMWDVYENYDVHAEKAKASAAEIAKNWTWAQTTDQFLEAFGGELSKPYTGNGTWVNTEPHLYRIVLLEDHVSHAAGVTREFIAGQEYWDLADIKRILFDAGKLDPVCLVDDDHGLAPEQLEGLDQYIAHKSHCSKCGQTLNSRPNLADKYYIEALEKRIEELEAERTPA